MITNILISLICMAGSLWADQKPEGNPFTIRDDSLTFQGNIQKGSMPWSGEYMNLTVTWEKHPGEYFACTFNEATLKKGKFLSEFKEEEPEGMWTLRDETTTTVYEYTLETPLSCTKWLDKDTQEWSFTIKANIHKTHVYSSWTIQQCKDGVDTGSCSVDYYEVQFAYALPGESWQTTSRECTPYNPCH